MATLVDKVSAILSDAFPEPALVQVTSGSWTDSDDAGSEDEGLIAFVISEGFEGVKELDRQRIVWKPLKKSLTPSERLKIAIVVPSTPAEEEFASAIKPL